MNDPQHDLLSSLLKAEKELSKQRQAKKESPPVINQINVNGSGGGFLEAVKMFVSGGLVAVVILAFGSAILGFVQPWIPTPVAVILFPCITAGKYDIPEGSPLKGSVVMTQGYATGTHTGDGGAVDLGINSAKPGGNYAEPSETDGAPIFATMDGVAKVQPNTWPGGNFLTITGVHYTTRFGHLREFKVVDKQVVKKGDLIGLVGYTGDARPKSVEGAHLHYEVWKDGKNVNPKDYKVMEPLGPTSECIPNPIDDRNTDVTGASRISAKRFDEILAVNGSPMQGAGERAIREGKQYNLDAAVLLSFFREESTYGKAGAAVATQSIGNIICAGYPTCIGRFRSYPAWEDGISDWYKLIAEEYVKGRNITGVHDILKVYAPFGDGDNNPDSRALRTVAALKCWSDESIPVMECERRINEADD